MIRPETGRSSAPRSAACRERTFQRIANENGGNRASGLPGYDASAACVKRRLQTAGYSVTEQTFEFPFFEENTPAELQQLTPTAKTYVLNTDFSSLEYSGSGDVSGTVVPVDVVLPPGPTPSGNTSGCEAADFAGFPAGAIALVQRGTCTFGEKAASAEAAGAAAVIVVNEGQPGRQDLLNGTLGGLGLTIPAVGTTFAAGQELAAGGVTARVATDTTSETRQTKNVLADSKGGDASRTVVVGAHLDSVPEGPGINDNGSGSAGILEIAEEMAELGVRPRQRVRFAF